jgi:hypothetical protein
MAGYGEPTRTPAQDANKGIVNPPAAPVTARTGKATRTKELEAGDIAAMQAGSVLGKTLQGYADKKADETRLTLFNKGAAKQGENMAIDQLEEENKRTGLAEFVFGQKATYRGAQQKAVTNNVQQAYLEDHYAIAEHAGDSPEEYQKYLNNRLKKMIEPFKGDTETQNMVAASWNKATEKLSANQYKENFAHTQMENRKEASKEARFKYDAVNVELDELPEEEHAAFITKSGKSLYGNVPENMTEKAYHAMLDEEVNASLAKGSRTALDLSEGAGAEDNLTLAQRVARDGAKEKYRSVQKQKAETAWQEVIGVVNKMGDSEDPDADMLSASVQYMETVTELEKQALDNEKSRTDIAELKNRLPIMFNKMVNANASANVKKKNQKDMFMAINQSLFGVTPEDQVSAIGVIAETRFTTVAKRQGMNQVIQSRVAQILGKDTPLTPAELSDALINDPTAIKEVQSMLRSSNIRSPMVEEILGSLIKNAGTRTDPNGMPIAMTVAQIKNLEGLDESILSILKGDTEQLTRWKVMKDGILAGWDADKIAAFADQTIETNSKEGLQLYSEANEIIAYDKDDEIRTRTDVVSAMFKEFTGTEPTPRQMSDHMDLYTRALKAVGGSHDDAKTYMKDVITNDSITYKGNYIAGGQYLNDKELFGDYDFDEAMTLMQTPILTTPGKPGSSIMTYMLGQMSGNSYMKNGKFVSDLTSVKGWEITADPRKEGFYIQINSARGEKLYVSKEFLRTAVMPTINIAAKQEKDRLENIAKIAAKKKIEAETQYKFQESIPFGNPKIKTTKPENDYPFGY